MTRKRRVDATNAFPAAAAAVSLAVAVWLCSPAGGVTAAERVAGQKWAVLVGIDDYTLAERLRYCAADQRALRDRLVAVGFPEKQVFLLEDGATESRYRPSKANIERQIESVLRLAEPGDFLLLGFSGHGTQIGKSMYLVPNDGDPEDAATLVTLDSVYERLQDCVASTKLVIVDACRNDPVRQGRRSVTTAEGSRALGRSLKEAPLPRGTVLINSCAPGEISWEEERFGHGVFMHYVLEGLGGRADGDGDGRLSLNELARYAAHETKTYVIHEKNVTQLPYLRNDGEAGLLDHPLLPVAKGAAGAALLASVTPRPVAGGVAKPGAVTTNSLGMKLVVIPAGEFDMGGGETPQQLQAEGFGSFASAGKDAVHYDPAPERPVHHVRITKPFHMGVHEVTLGQFLTFYHAAFKGRLECEVGGKPALGYAPGSGEYFVESRRFRPWDWGHPGQTNDHPVVNVSWNDCVAFCRWLSQKEGRKYRLPTEAEWEYACRAGTRTQFWCGNDPETLPDVDNFSDAAAAAMFPWWKSGATHRRDGHVFTAPVGSFRANPFGLHDMHGNVVEWCSDWYSPTGYTGRLEVDPVGPAAGGERVSRGGGWNYKPVFCRSAYRNHWSPDALYFALGFRVVCEIE